jgi:hypothetical protein
MKNKLNKSDQTFLDSLPESERTQLAAAIATEETVLASAKWTRIGIAAMDTASLLITDPCYVIPDSPSDEVEIPKRYPDAYPTDGQHSKQLCFRRGHAGAGIVVSSPHGDGTVDVWAKLDGKGKVRAVFFSFDGEMPTIRALTANHYMKINNDVETVARRHSLGQHHRAVTDLRHDDEKDLSVRGRVSP